MCFLLVCLTCIAQYFWVNAKQQLLWDPCHQLFEAFFTSICQFPSIKGERKRQITYWDQESLDLHHKKQTRSYSKVQSWNKIMWVLMRWIISLSNSSKIGDSSKIQTTPCPKVKQMWKMQSTSSKVTGQSSRTSTVEDRRCVGRRMESISVQAVSISIWKGGITGNSLIWICLWFSPSWEICVNQNLFVSFLFQAFPEAAKNVFCIRPYADFCFHVAGNNPPDLYQPFPRNSSNSFKKYKREKSSGKEQDGVSRCIFRKTSLNLKHEMNP